MLRLIPNRLGPVSALMLVFGCAGGQRTSETPGSNDADLAVPALAFFESGVPKSLTLSPSGRFVAGILTKGAEDSVVVIDTKHAGDGNRVRALTQINRDAKPGRSIDQIAWANDEMLLVSATMPVFGARIASRQSRLLVANMKTGEVDYVTKDWPEAWKRGFHIRALIPLADDPDHVLLTLYLPMERFPSVRRLNVRTGDLELVQKPIWGVSSWGIDHKGDVRVGVGASYPEFSNRGGKVVEGTLVARSDPDAKFNLLRRWRILEDEGLGFAGFGTDPNMIYVSVEEGPKRTHTIYEYDIEENARGRRVFGVPDYDVETVATSRVDGRPLYMPYHTEKPEMELIDPARARVQALVDRELPGRINRAISADQSETRFIFSSYADVAPPEYYLVDLREKTMDLLFVSYPELPRSVLRPMTPIRYFARDGLEIHGDLTRARAPGEGRSPVIVMPHGGPFSRDTWGFNARVQFFANRGFTVFRMNFRGSTGYGADFEVRGYGEWGLAMQRDITDGVNWLIEEGIADRDRIGIYGASYGGYAALQALVETPELYRAGASFAGVTDLRLMLLRDEARRYYEELNDRLIGNRRDDKDRLVATSPASQAGRIEVPVLLAHGTGDSVVDVKHARTMARALRAEDAPVEVIIIEDEVHRFLDPTREAEFFERVTKFFEEHLTKPAVRPN